jgi:hypothetical protein
MALVENLITIVRAQRTVNHARTITHDLSVMPHYRARIRTQFIDGVMMVEKKRFMGMTLTTDGSCLTTHTSYVCSIATSMLRYVGASRPSSIFKYIHKGHDRASVAVREVGKEDNKGNIDEIELYRDARWVTPPEALWRIYGFDISDRSPSVLSLQLHHPSMHMVSFHQREGVR